VKNGEASFIAKAPVDSTEIAPAEDALQPALMEKGQTNSYDDVKVNEGQAIKMGKSGAGGDMTITVGAGTTKLCFYAAGWNKEDGSVTITAPEGVTITPATIDVVANSVFQGTGKSFTVSNESDYAFGFAVEGAEEAVTFTLNSTKRCFVWGATYGKGAIVAAPQFLPEESSFQGSVEVSISAAEGAKIYYTLDATDPTIESTEYEAPFTLTQSTLVKAIAAVGNDLSVVAAKKYSKLDTVSVTEARALIDAKDDGAHYVRGVAAGAPFIFSGDFKGNIVVWMTDEANPKDSLEAYYIAGKDNQPWESLVAAKDEIQEGDTILVFASELTYYEKNKVYEIAKGYYVEKLGAAQVTPIEADTLSVAQAIEQTQALADNAQSEEKVFVEGYAVNVDPYSASYGNQIFFMVDSVNAPDSVFEAYAADPKKDGKAYPVLAGDKVRAYGYLKKYVKDGKAQLEIVNPAVEFIEEVEGDRTIVIPTVDTITVAQALEIGGALASGGVSEKEYVIKGYSCDIYAPFDETYKNETFWINDVKGTRTNDKTKAFEVYRGKPNTEKEIGLDALIQIKCKIKNYNGTIENDGVNITFEVLEQGIIETVDTITVAQALEIGKALEPGSSTSKSYEITGYVSSIQNYFDEQYKNETFWISDVKGTRTNDKTKAFEVYRGKPNTEKEIGLNAKVRLVCKIKNYNGTIENDGTNITVEVLEQGFIPDPDTISVAEAVAIAQKLSPGKYSDLEYVVVGYAVSVYEKNTDGSWSFYMADDADVKGEFMASNCKTDADVLKNDYMYVRGKVTKYESKSGNTILQIYQGKGVHGVAPVIPEITVAQALEFAQALDPEEGKSVTVDQKYAIKAYIYSVEDEDEHTYLLSDDIEGENELMALECNVDSADVFEDL
jgi:hypothetical protein